MQVKSRVFIVAIRSFKYITDPKALDAVADETRRKIIYLLRAKEQTVSQIAEALGKTPQAIYHQIRKLTAAGLVEVAREERVGHFIETYYRATAEVFEFRHGEPSAKEGGPKSASNHTAIGLRALPRLGIKVKVDDETIERVGKAHGRIAALEVDPALEERIMNLDDVDFVSKQSAYFLAKYATMTDKQFEEMVADMKELRRLLTSGAKKKDGPAQRPMVA
jgi:DNA-binding transcriptional ArsR family regulator